MSTETREEILDLINYRPNGKRLEFDIRNSLSALFDGFLYDDILKLADEIDDEEFVTRVEKIVVEVSYYPIDEMTQV